MREPNGKGKHGSSTEKSALEIENQPMEAILKIGRK